VKKIIAAAFVLSTIEWTNPIEFKYIQIRDKSFIVKLRKIDVLSLHAVLN